MLKHELAILRVSVARIAQALEVDNELQIAGNSYSGLYDKASCLEMGWNDLAGACCDEAIRLKQAQRSHVGTLTGLATDELTYRKVSVSADQVEALVLAASAVIVDLDFLCDLPGDLDGQTRRDALVSALKSITGSKS